MSRRHIGGDAPVDKPSVVRTILTGRLEISLGGVKPEVKLTQLSSGNFEVSYSVHGATHGRLFDNTTQAERYFGLITGRHSRGDFIRRTMIKRSLAEA